eukprot:CAMPEP_0184699714 /NCGR_PEP_ID=MMETSP0313-20130426/5877_1 /TAXON_ID=2792 /ORGANISM="Porphyridium aerugineum, Strain SAG 1380-2" /LENGTH=365 /DNA_ID=CAMNT_0027158837 /DNA_START=295 /DNA_END=1392 /DNA_ORIENTATION=-
MHDFADDQIVFFSDSVLDGDEDYSSAVSLIETSKRDVFGRPKDEVIEVPERELVDNISPRKLNLLSLGTPGTSEYIEAVRSHSRCFALSADACRRRDLEARDLVWEALRNESIHFIQEEPLLASQLFAAIINQRSFGGSIAYIVSNLLSSDLLPGSDLLAIFHSAIHKKRTLEADARDDLLAAVMRDPAATGFLDVLLHSKGLHALEAYRVSHELWVASDRPGALLWHSLISNNFQVDIHPAAKIGSGVLIDHATCVVIGETAIVGNRVSMLQHVTLGGVGRKATKRHPTIGDDVVIGAGATILGDVRVNNLARVGACSLVYEDVAPTTTVVGVPATVVNEDHQSAALPKFLAAPMQDNPDACDL